MITLKMLAKLAGWEPVTPLRVVRAACLGNAVVPVPGGPLIEWYEDPHYGDEAPLLIWSSEGCQFQTNQWDVETWASLEDMAHDLGIAIPELAPRAVSFESVLAAVVRDVPTQDAIREVLGTIICEVSILYCEGSAVTVDIGLVEDCLSQAAEWNVDIDTGAVDRVLVLLGELKAAGVMRVMVYDDCWKEVK